MTNQYVGSTIFTMDQQNSCQNCYYFRQHYYKSTHGKLVKVCDDGHCTNDNLTKATSRKNILKCSVCEFWKPQEQQIIEQREGVIRVIFEIRKKLEEIALILKDD